MRLAWATDTHLNFVDDDEVLRFGRELAGYDGAVITGDVSDLANLARHLKILASAGATVWFVAGNHDAYGGSVSAMRSVLRKVAGSGTVRYLHDMGPVRLSDKTVLVGADGWYDGRNGNYLGSRVQLTDFLAITEMVGSRQSRLREMQRLADESAAMIESRLSAALALPGVERVVVATHVPPFPGASWHEGKPSDDHFNPFFSNRTVGEAVLRAASGSSAEVTVLCGHSHSPGVIRPAPGVECRTGGAKYGEPRVFEVLDL